MTKEELEKEAEEKYSEVDREFMDCQDEGEIFNLGYLASAEPREKCIAELEKENAELKKELKDANKKVVHLACNQNKDLKRKINKAKEIIKDLMSYSVQLCDCRHTVDFEKTREEAEQFLSEVEK